MHSYEDCTYWDAKKEGGVVMRKKGLLAGICMIASLAMFTGCVNTESLSKEIVIQGTNKEHIAYDLEDWKDLMSEIDVLRMYSGGTEIWVRDDTYDDVGKSTYVGEDRSYIWIADIKRENGKKAITYIARHTGEGIYEAVKEAENLEESVDTAEKIIEMPRKMLTKTLGNYSVIFIKDEGKLGLYVMHEPFKLKQEVDRDFINQFKTDGFLLKAFSQGTEENVIEMCTPSFMIRTYGAFLYNSTSYYQFFRNADNELIKTRMVINAYSSNGIYKEEFAPLEKVIAYLGGEESLNAAIQDEVSQILEGNSEGKILKSGDLKCTIKKHDGTIYQEKLIEIVIE